MDVILDIFKDKLVCFCVLYLKAFFKKCIFMVLQFSHVFILQAQFWAPLRSLESN